MAEINAKKVRRIFHGEQKVYEDAGQTWLPCGGQGSGTVFMRDNGDGTASLSGMAPAGTIIPPKGYKFIGALKGVVSVNQSSISVGMKAVECTVNEGNIVPGDDTYFILFGVQNIYQGWIQLNQVQLASCDIQRV